MIQSFKCRYLIPILLITATFQIYYISWNNNEIAVDYKNLALKDSFHQFLKERDSLPAFSSDKSEVVLSSIIERYAFIR